MIGAVLRMTSCGIPEQTPSLSRQNTIHVRRVGEFRLILSYGRCVRIIHLGQLIRKVSGAIGSVALYPIPHLLLRYFSLQAVSSAAVMVMVAIEIVTDTIGPQCLTAFMPASSPFPASVSTSSAMAVRAASLSAASRQPTKSLSFSEE